MEPRSGWSFYLAAMQICRRLGKVDGERAERIAAAVETPGARACAWAFTALGAAERDKAAASRALDRAIEAIDRVRESGPGPEPVTNLDGVDTIYPTNPAVVVLPIVEQVAPERLGEFFWRAVALHERVGPEREDELQKSGIGFECTLLAHYDRGVAAVLFEPMDSFIQSVMAQKGRSGEMTASVIVAKGCIDPKAGAELIESLAPDAGRPGVDSANQARMQLAGLFAAQPGDRRSGRWRRLLRSMSAQVPLEGE